MSKKLTARSTDFTTEFAVKLLMAYCQETNIPFAKGTLDLFIKTMGHWKKIMG